MGMGQANVGLLTQTEDFNSHCDVIKKSSDEQNQLQVVPNRTDVSVTTEVRSGNTNRLKGIHILEFSRLSLLSLLHCIKVSGLVSIQSV
jgi:hypothetical protein